MGAGSGESGIRITSRKNTLGRMIAGHKLRANGYSPLRNMGLPDRLHNVRLPEILVGCYQRGFCDEG